MRRGTLLLLLLWCAGCDLSISGPGFTGGGGGDCFLYCPGIDFGGGGSGGGGGGGGSGGGGGGGGGSRSHRMSISVQPGSAAQQTLITPAVRVQLLDATGNVVTGATDSVTIGISSNPDGGTLSGTTTVAASNGVAIFSNLSIDRAGIYTLMARAAGFSPAYSLGFNVWCSCWISSAPMPTAREGAGVAVVNSVLYAVGGYNTSNGYLASVETFDPASNSWTTVTSMPTARSRLGVGIVNGILYAVGGSSGSTALATVEAYDPATNTWTTKAPMPTARSGLGVGVVNGLLYAVGGYSATYVTAVEAYDPVTNSWTTNAALPTARTRLGVGVLNGILYAVGGFDLHSAYPTTRVEAFDPVTNSWTSKAPMWTPRAIFGVGVINGRLFAVGGLNDYIGTTATVEAYDPSQDR